MAPFERSMDEFAANVHATCLEWAKKMDGKVPSHISEAVANSVGNGAKYLAQLISWLVHFLSGVPPQIRSHASVVDAAARKHVLPVVQPHLDRASRSLAPVTAWTHENVTPSIKAFEKGFDEQTKQYSHLQIAAFSVLFCFLLYFVLSRLTSWIMDEPTKPAAQRRAEFLRSLPGIRGMITKERAKAIANIKGEIASREVDTVTALVQLPLVGLDCDSVMMELEERASNDFRYADGESKTTGTIYMAGDVHRELLNDAYCMFSQSNPLHPDLFPSVRRMEAEVVSMTASLLGGGHEGVPEVCGTMTSGGSESNIAAVLASLNFIRETRGITEPEIIIGETAHASFWKAAKFARVKLVVVPVSQKTFQLSAAAVLSRMTNRTALVVASAPTYPHGIIDDIAGIARVATRYRACLHVDCCLGGFVLPFMRRLRLEVPPFDFAVPGVTSMSVDTHKYGLAHKGTSVVLFRSKTLRSAQYTPVVDWSGGIYVSPGLAGSRSGGLVATAWAALRHVGLQGYIDVTRSAVKAAGDFADVVRGVPELQILGTPRVTTVSFKSTKSSFSVLQLQEQLLGKGWHFHTLIKPTALHFVFTQQHAAVLPALKEDFLAACAALRALPPKDRAAAAASDKVKVYGLAASVSGRGVVTDLLMDFQDAMLEAE